MGGDEKAGSGGTGAGGADGLPVDAVRRALDESGAGLLVVDAAGRIAFASRSVADALGYEPGELRSEPVTLVVPGESTDAVLDRFERALERDPPTLSDVPLAHRGGRELPFDLVLSATDGSGGRLVTALVVTPAGVVDPTAVSTAELYRLVFERSDDGVLVIDAERDAFRAANPRACELLGYGEAELLTVPPSAVHAEDIGRYRAFLDRVRTEGTRWTDELTCTRKDGSQFLAEVVASVVDLDDRPHVLALLRDATAFRAYERVLERHTTALDAAIDEANDGIALLDVDGEITYANRAFAAMFGYRRESLLGRHWKSLYDDAEAERLDRRIRPALWATGSWRTETVGTRANGTTVPQSLSLSTLDDGGVVCIVRDLSGQQRRERRLEALSEATAELLDAGSAAEIAALTVRAVADVLDYPMSGVVLYDPGSDALVLAGASRKLLEVADLPERFDVAETPLGQVYREGEPVIRLLDEADREIAGPISQTLLLPLGEHGLLGVGGLDDEGFDRGSVNLAEILASNVAAALSRAKREAQLAAAREELAAQRDELLRQRDSQRTLLRVSELARDVATAVVGARSREDVERTVCERLASSELYHFAWIGEYSPNRSRIVPRAAAGVDEGFLDEVADIVVTDGERGAIDLAVETGEPQVVRELGEVDRLHAPVRQAAIDRGFEAALAVPLAYRGRNYGALVVIASHPGAFEEYELATFETLGELVGFSLRAANDRELLYADTVVEVELRSRDRGSFFVDASARLDCEIRFVGTVPGDDGSQKLYGQLAGATADELRELAAGWPDVDAVELIDEGSDGSLIAVRLRGGSMTADLTESGAHILEAEVDRGETRFLIEVPSRDDARSVIEGYLAAYPDSEIVTIREQDHPVRTITELSGQLLADLTERQALCLRTAYLEGYYDWPRRSSAEEVAARLGISSATFHQHLRLAQAKLLDAILS